jgi:hypothetical protein
MDARASGLLIMQRNIMHSLVVEYAMILSGSKPLERLKG